MATDQQILDGNVINAPKGRFATPRDRAQALLLNEYGWLGCRKCGEWQDSEVGAPCRCGGTQLREERLPDAGSVFAQVYTHFKENA